MNKKFVDQNITYNTLLYLELIYSMNGTCTASELSELLYVSKPGVTHKINELIKQVLVIKTSDPKYHHRNFLSVNEEVIPVYHVYRKQENLAIKNHRRFFGRRCSENQ